MILIILEKIYTRIKIELKIAYWKIKYGKKIKIGKNNRFRKRFNILIEKDGYLEIGDNNFFNNDCSITCLSNIKIGNNNMFGENVKIYDHNHKFNSTDEELRNKFLKGNIKIGNCNWICSNVVLLKNTNMKDRNVIGANIVMDKSIDSFILLKNKYDYEENRIKINN
jgi:acetyltransferase-like isoleucine patch superfamily enzyme